MTIANLHTINNFGAVDADADELLRKCFQSHPAYHSVREMRSFLVLGRKGAGKTAIYRKLLTDGKSESVVALGHSFDDYPWNHHDLQAQHGVPDERRFLNSWKYLILMGLAKVVLNQDATQPWSDVSEDSLMKVEDFVVDTYGTSNPDFRQLFSPERKLKFKLGGEKLGLETVDVKNLAANFREVNAFIQEHIFASLNPQLQYYVCFDQLDLGFSPDDSLYSERLVGLILAAKEIFLAAREKQLVVNPVVFLREDIYQDLHFEDKNKITENYSTSVIWKDAEGGHEALKNLMVLRFKEVLGNEHIAWDDIFDETKQMPGRQSKYRHITDRTFLRPRDMIKFCNEVLEAHKKEAGSGPFENGSLHEARSGYSDYLLNELDDEVAKNVPDYQGYLEVLKTVGKEKFTRSEFASVLQGRGNDLDAGDALRDMFSFSIVSYLKSGGRGGGSEYVWRYRDPRARFDPAADDYRVHPGLKETLGLVR